MKIHTLHTPLNDETVKCLTAGDRVFINGTIYTARDAAHKRFCDLLSAGKKLPVNLDGQIIYFCGPAPAKPGQPIGSAGPTTSYRMDAYSPMLIEKVGLKGMIGKGNRTEAVIEAMKTFGGVYLAATGGAAALIARQVVSSEIICYDDLGAEAVRKLEVREFPAIVAIDCFGNNLYLH